MFAFLLCNLFGTSVTSNHLTFEDIVPGRQVFGADPMLILDDIVHCALRVFLLLAIFSPTMTPRVDSFANATGLKTPGDA